jgi:L-lysine 2,3-aminomutase
MQNSQQDWQQALANAISNPQELCEILDLDRNEFQTLISRDVQFPMRVPRGFVSRMEKGNCKDPLLLQVLPIVKEMEITSAYCQDPLQEKQANPLPGLLHKYHGRVLLIAASGCAIHCRYCFRRHFPYEDNTPGVSGWQPVLDYIAKDATISEVILSGGDPLILKDASLKNLIDRLAAIPHVQILRLHTRLPVVLPERITPSLIQILTGSRLRVVVVIHCNHPREIDANVAQALSILRQANITLLNQFVMLREINDTADVLVQLCQELFKYGVLPYYLHLLDPVQGAAHFAVSAEEANHLIQQITAQLPGYLVPKLVCELPGAAAKVSLTS